MAKYFLVPEDQIISCVTNGRLCSTTETHFIDDNGDNRRIRLWSDPGEGFTLEIDDV